MAGTISPDIFDLVKLCKDNNLFLIEKWRLIDGKAAGTIGLCFHFIRQKLLLVVKEECSQHLTKKFLNLRGVIKTEVEIWKLMKQYINKGRNVRMTEISALLGRIQLSNLENFIAKNKKISFYIL